MAFKEDIDNYYINAIITFVLFNTVYGMFSGYMGGKLIRLIQGNDYLRTFFLFLVIWFTINDILGTKNQLSIGTSFAIAILVVVFILVFSRQPLWYNIAESLILITIYAMNVEKANFSPSTVDKVNTATNVLYFILIPIMLVGFYKYYLIKKKEKGKRFVLRKFFIGEREKPLI